MGWKRGFLTLGALLGALLLVLVVRALLVTSQQPEVAPAPLVEIDEAAAAAHLAAGLRLPTISHQDRSQLDPAPFHALHDLLEETYPATHRALSREHVSELSLLYTWPGTKPELAPVLLMAHQDVVPVDEAAWSHPPFGGVIEDGVIWGRGAIDDKGRLFAQLEAVEWLLGQGFTPERTVLLAFGHDEEVGGPEGAMAIAALLEARGVRPRFVLDEGGMVVEGGIAGLERPIALLSIAEKGSMTLRLRIEGPGGHSSVPPPHTLIGDMSAALTRLEANPMPVRIQGASEQFIDGLTPELPFLARLVLANRWLFDPLIGAVAGRSGTLNAMLRTTTAVTMIEGGVKSNVLPSRVEAVVNFRLAPGDRSDDVADHVARVIADDRIEILGRAGSKDRKASPVSPTDGESYALVERTIREIHPDVPVVPFLLVGGTDSRHFAGLTPDIYRFNPFRFGADLMTLAHGTDERISVENLASGVRFYIQLIRNAAGA